MLTLIAAALAADPTVALSVNGEAVLAHAINDRFRGSSLGGQLQASLPVYGPIDARLTVGYHRLTGIQLTTETLWYAPVDLTAALSIPVGRATFFVHAGPSLVVWSGTPDTSSPSPVDTAADTADTGATTTVAGVTLLDDSVAPPPPKSITTTTPVVPRTTGSSGGNWGVVAEIGVRFPTRLYQPPMYDTTPVLQGLDVVISAGGRWSDVHDAALAETQAACHGTCGLDFSAIRLNAGLAARF